VKELEWNEISNVVTRISHYDGTGNKDMTSKLSDDIESIEYDNEEVERLGLDLWDDCTLEVWFHDSAQAGDYGGAEIGTIYNFDYQELRPTVVLKGYKNEDDYEEYEIELKIKWAVPDMEVERPLTYEPSPEKNLKQNDNHSNDSDIEM
jgi:hypothetical protein